MDIFTRSTSCLCFCLCICLYHHAKWCGISEDFHLLL